jgi:hypothetical protein
MRLEAATQEPDLIKTASGFFALQRILFTAKKELLCRIV